MRLNRRTFLASLATAGAASVLTGAARAQDGEGGGSLWDMFTRNQTMREADVAGNIEAARASLQTFEPILSYDTAYNLELAISQYEPFVAQGGWQSVPREVYQLRMGHSRRAVIDLKNRLMQGGDLEPQARFSDMVDNDTDRALRVFQARHGLVVSGEVDEPTFAALNVPAETRLHQLRLNLQRVHNMAAQLAERYAVVNIPAATIEAVEDGFVAQRHTAVVGRVDRATPILASRIHEINFNPYWHVPTSIIRNDLIRYMNEDPEYLTKFQIKIFDGNGNEIAPTQINWQTDEAVRYMFRQEPGAENSMGHVKINFHNPHSVYLHDTPTKQLFAETGRFHSSGCVRVDEVEAFVAWVLRDNGGWDTESVRSMFDSGARMDVNVSRPVPIHTTYITAWANRQGVVSFRDDVYNYDAEGRTSFG